MVLGEGGRPQNDGFVTSKDMQRSVLAVRSRDQQPRHLLRFCRENLIFIDGRRYKLSVNSREGPEGYAFVMNEVVRRSFELQNGSKMSTFSLKMAMSLSG